MARRDSFFAEGVHQMSRARVNATSMRENFALLLRWAAGPVAVALALAGCGGGDTVAPADANAAVAPARASQAQAMELPQPARGQRLALPRAGALAAGSTDSAAEDFEAGMARWSNWGNAQVVAGAGTSGSHALRVGTGAGGAALRVTGLVPGTTYRLTARLKVSDPSEAVFASINMLTGSGSFGPRPGPVRSTGYVTISAEIAATETATSADVWVWKNEGTGYGYIDDVVFGPVDGTTPPPPPPPPPPPSGNMISNGEFESGMTGWSNWGNAQVVAGQGTSGSNAMQVGTGAGGAAFRVSGLVPGTTYRLTARLKVSDPSETVFAGINMLNSSGGFNGGTRSGPVTSTSYVVVSVDFAAGGSSTSADVWVWKNAGAGYGYIDDVVFGPAGAAPPPSGNLLANGGFESGMQGWVDWGNTALASGQGSSGTWALRVGTAAGGAGHDVGIVAGATYRLTAKAMVSAPSDTVYVGINILDQSHAVIARNFVPVGSTAYGTASFSIVAPANAVRAVVYVWKDAGSGFAYVDDFVLETADGSAPPAPPPAANLVTNGGFESALSGWVDWGNAATSGQAAEGAAAAQVGTGAGGFGQDVGGIVAGGTYRLSGLAKVSTAGETGYLGVRFTDDAGTRLLEQSAAFGSTAYAAAQLELVAPANATRALVYVWKNAGGGFAYVDQVALGQVAAP